jgi:hypothetical protein
MVMSVDPTYHPEYRFLRRLLQLARDDQLIQNLQGKWINQLDATLTRVLAADSRRRLSES